VAVDGTRLCTLTQVEVERHESSRRGPVVRRHDIAFQPLAIPEAAAQEEDNIISGHEDMRQLYKHMDYLATQAITTTLSKQPAVGTEVTLDMLVPNSLLTKGAAQSKKVQGLCGRGCHVPRFVAAT
jgi:hypothetical protein